MVTTAPDNLFEWRHLTRLEAVDVWSQLRPFFAQHGYTLFVNDQGTLRPPPELSQVRGPDEYHHWLPTSVVPKPPASCFQSQTGVQTAARSSANTDVVIRLLAVGDDGHECLSVLRTLSAPGATVAENHTLPMIDELHTDGMTFGVFPFMRDRCDLPWFETTGQMLDMFDQVLEGFAYMHEKLVAHRDFGLSEIFINFGAPKYVCVIPETCNRVIPQFRSHFPVRYYINDFEHSVQFDPATDPATRLVTGLAIECYGYTIDDYMRPVPPEARTGAPYCPFKMDIYQLGKCAIPCHRVEGIPRFHALFEAMTSDNPHDRPSAAEALATLREIRSATPADVLDQAPKHMTLEYFPHPPVDCECLTCKPYRFPLRDVTQSLP